MNAEILQTLLIDRSLGALSVETEALLADYLDRHPETAALAREYSETATLARLSLGSAKTISAPPFPGYKIRLAQRSLVRRRRLRVAALLAASLLLGTVFGTLVSRQSLSPHVGQKSPATVTTIETPQPPSTESTTPSARFWSRARFLAQNMASSDSRSPRFAWISPIRTPIPEPSHDSLDHNTQPDAFND
jgi:hypothetical protein